MMQRGLLFRLHPHGTQRLPDGQRGDWWISYICAAGHRHREKVGPKGRARDEHSQRRLQVRRDAFCPLAERRARPITLKDFSRRYLDEYARANKRSWETDQYRLGTLLPRLGDVLLTDLRPDVIERYKTERVDAHKAPGTVNRELALLRRMLSLAVEWGLLTQHPMATVKSLQEPPGRLRYLSADEYQALLAACAPHLRPIVVCAVHTGMRKGEILGLTWDQVDVRKRVIRVVRTKSGQARAIPINDPLAAELQRLPRRLGTDVVFWNEQTGRRYVDVGRAFESALARAGLSEKLETPWVDSRGIARVKVRWRPLVRFHDLRHTFATHVQAGLGDLRVTQALLGHQDIRMTLRYAHLSETRLRDAVAHLPAALTALVSGTQSGTSG